ncbi:MAG: ribbon-helix-helix domain-containing protein [Geminicoccaceae bacterium]
MKDKQVSIRLPQDLVEELDATADEQHSSRTALIVTALRQHFGHDRDSEAVVASLDRLAEAVERSQADLVGKLATGLAELHDRTARLEARFDELEEFHTHHLFNFLAYVAPDADEEAAAARGRKRLVNTMRALEHVRSGRLKSLFLRAREEAARQENEEVAGTARAGNQLAK